MKTAGKSSQIPKVTKPGLANVPETVNFVFEKNVSMNTTLELEQLIHQLNSEDLPKVQAFVESLLSKEQKANGKNGHSTVRKEDATLERLRIAQKFKGKARFPETLINKYEVYEQ